MVPSPWPTSATKANPETFTIPFKKPKDGQLTIDEQSYNALHGTLRCLGERANSVLKTTSAPRGAVMYPPRSGERLEEMSLDLMALPELERKKGP
jgi:hypothetical protein